MPGIPASNRIHTLPILVNYHLPTSSSSFTTLFSAPQQVYVHANAASKGEGELETWGSIYLKTVVQGVMMASPELHPFDKESPDASLYVFDPRETFLRRQRSANLPSHLRSDRGSSPAGLPSSPAGTSSLAVSEVWAGKGLLSWALAEAGQGKNLITGRLVKSTAFSSVSSGNTDVGALEALMMADQDGCWGLEVNLSMRTKGMPMTGPLVPIAVPELEHRPSLAHHDRHSSTFSHAPSEFGRDKDSEPVSSSSSSRPAVGPSREPHRPVSAPRRPSRLSSPTRAEPRSDSAPSQPGRTGGTSASGRKRKITPSVPSSNASDSVLRSLSTNTDVAAAARAVRADSTGLKHLPSIPAAVYNNPSSLTKDQVHRLLASPAFLDLLEKTAGQSLSDASKGSVENAQVKSAKRVKHEHSESCSSTELKCYNCGRTKSSVWRSRTMDDGNTVRVCNACGLYWNQRKEMRPPNLWSAVDDDVLERPRVQKKPIIPRNPPPASLTARAAAQAAQAKQAAAASASFKRTLSAVADQDAKRIAARRPSAPAAPAPRSNLSAVKNAPATSPAQCTRAKTMRNASWQNGQGQAASSPGGFIQPAARAVKAHEAFEPMSTIGESPALSTTTTTMMASSQIQSLQLPLSDDPFNADNWGTDISTIFDIDAYSERFDKDFPASLNDENIQTQQPLRRSPRKHNKQSPARGHRRSDTDSDTVSNLFQPSSNASPKSSFDFSALPPSSPPFMLNETSNNNNGIHLAAGGHNPLLPHSALLMSSPDFSPLSSMFGPSPVESTNGGMRLTPEKNKSGLRNSFTPMAMQRQDSDTSQGTQVQGQSYGFSAGLGGGVSHGYDAYAAPQQHQIMNPVESQGQGEMPLPLMTIDEITQALNNSGMDQAAWDELFGLMGSIEADPNSAVGDIAAMGGGNGQQVDDEWTALINTLG